MYQLFAAWLLWSAAAHAADFRDAVAALQRGDLATAERILRAEIAVKPNDAPALSTLGVVLDNQAKYAEAAPFHRRAAAAAPTVADVFSNYGNHLAASGDSTGAAVQYGKALNLDPAHVNANLQLARLAPGSPEALDHLKRVPAAQVDVIARKDPNFGVAAGVAYAKASQFDRAETLFTEVLAARPADFNVLVNLGLVAASAGHLERSREVLESALRQQPQNVDLLVRLAAVDQAVNHSDSAVRRLAQAAKLAPDNPEVHRMLAVSAAALGALDDAIAAWDRYRRLAPSDDIARRERGYLAVELGRIQEGTSDLEWFLGRHPDDALAHYDLGMALGDTAHLTKALTLKPDFTAARSARGNLYYQEANFDAALTDLEPASRERPNDPVVLDRLGQTYLSLDRPTEAARTLRRATELAPTDSKIWFHLGRALAESDQPEESKRAMARFRELGPAAKSGVPAGLVEYLSLTPEQQRADYRARVGKVLRERPSDAAAQLESYRLQIEDGDLPDSAVPAASILLTQVLPARPDLYWHTVSVLLRTNRVEEALTLAVHNADGELIHALLEELAGRTADATRELDALRSRRPEWFAVWVAGAFVAAGRNHMAEARQALDTGKSLGALTADTSAGIAGLLRMHPPWGW